MEASTGRPCGPHWAQLVTLRVARWMYVAGNLAACVALCVYYGGGEGAVNCSIAKTMFLFTELADSNVLKFK